MEIASKMHLSNVKKCLAAVWFTCSFLVHALAQTSEPYNWNSIAIGGGGFVSGIITSKAQAGLMYARTDVGGAYRWDALSNKWIPLMDWASENEQGMFGVESMATDPQQPNILYALTGISYFNSGKSYILRSTDYGATFSINEVTNQFKAHGNGQGRQTGEKLQVDPNNSTVLFCGTRRDGLFKSTDSGSSWSKLASLNVASTPNDNGVSFVLLDKASVAGGLTKRIFVGVSRIDKTQNLYRSDDGGATFAAVINSSLPDAMMPQRAVLASDGNMYITYANGAGPNGTTAEPIDQGQIWKYSISTSAWTNISPTLNRAYCGISVDPLNPLRLLASTTNTYMLQKGNVYGDRMFLSTNGGSSWTDVVTRGFDVDPNGSPWISGNSIHWAGCIEFDPFNSKKAWVISGNGIFLNDDIDAAAGIWKFSAKGLEETVPRNLVSIPGGPLISVIGDYDGFTQTDPSVYASNRHTPTMGSTTGLDYSASTKSKVVRAGSKMYVSSDMGITWAQTVTMNGTGGHVAVSANGSTILHGPSGSAITYRSTDNGTNWSTITGLTFADVRPVADGANSSKFYAYNPSASTMMASTDGGSTFVAAGSTGAGGSKIIRTIPGREGHIWVALSGGGLSRSVNSAVSFSKINSVSSCTSVGFGKASPGAQYETIYIWGTVAGVSGLHRSTDEGATWVRVNDEAHEYGGPGNGQFVVGDMNVYGRVYMSTAGRGIVYGDVQPAANTAPTDISLSNADVVQGNPIGEVIGTLSSTDANAGNTFAYTLVNGTGSTDNAAFAIVGTQLQAGIVFNHALKQNYSIRVRSTDNGGLSFEKVFLITIRKVFSLPNTNFRVQAFNETCSNNNDGKITITAERALSYKATLTYNATNTEFPFTNTLEIPSLVAGVYTVCITVQGQSAYQQCYSLTIVEPQPLSVYATVNMPAKLLMLDLAGGADYQVQLNGKSFNTSAPNVSLSLANGVNQLMVSTGNTCQGLFKKTIFIADGQLIYPNPFDNALTIALGNDTSARAHVELLSTAGQKIFAGYLKTENGLAELALPGLKSGIYIINIKTDLGSTTSKLIKK